MKEKTARAFLIALLLTASSTVFSTGAQAKLDCVRLSQIAEMPVIDENTILMRLNGRGHYKRVDLGEPCPDLLFNGFVHSSHDGQFCNDGPLHIIDGGICVVKDIVDIPPDEAKALLARARDKRPAPAQTDAKP